MCRRNQLSIKEPSRGEVCVVVTQLSAKTNKKARKRGDKEKKNLLER
jgi:hypothetical protein